MSQSDQTEITEEDIQLMERYRVAQVAAARKTVFDTLVTTCYRTLPLGMLEVGMQFAVGNPPLLVVQVVGSAHGLRFAVLSSLCDGVPVDPANRLNISTASVFTGRPPRGTPAVPTTKAAWSELSGAGSAKLLLWKFMCDFKNGVKTNIRH
jgi:hypothetical protein